MTEYLTAYMKSAEERLDSCSSMKEWKKLFDEHKDKIAFMQHERIVHFLVTMMFALILTILIAALLFTTNLAVLVLVTIMVVLIAFYIKHYYFLENTVQKMYKLYDRMLAKKEELSEEEE